MWNNISGFAREETCPGWSPDTAQQTVEAFTRIWFASNPDETVSRGEWSRLLFEEFNYYCCGDSGFLSN